MGESLRTKDQIQLKSAVKRLEIGAFPKKRLGKWTNDLLFIFSERDTLDRDIMELKKCNTMLDAALKAKSDSLLELQKEVC